MEKVIELKKLEVEKVLSKCEELGVEHTQLMGYGGPHSYMFKGEAGKIREALSVALDEDDLYEIFEEDDDDDE